MLLPGRKRARSDADLDLRRQSLIDAARALLQTHDYDKILMAQVAANAGLSKASAYHYFTSKEELFLAFLQLDLSQWFIRLQAQLTQTKRGSVEDIAACLTDAMVTSPVLLTLLGLLQSRLETNVPLRALSDFKMSLLSSVQTTGAVIDVQLRLTEGIGAELLLRLNALAIGLSAMATPSESVEAVMSDAPELGSLRTYFAEDLKSALTDLIVGRMLRAGCDGVVVGSTHQPV